MEKSIEILKDLEKKGTDKDARTALENVNSTVCSGDEFRKILDELKRIGYTPSRIIYY